MNINIPENLDDLTLGQWQEIMAIDENAEAEFYMRRILSIVYNIKGKFKDIKESDIELMADTVRKILAEKPVFKNRFKLGDVTTGHGNIAIGSMSMLYNTTGNNNVAIGRSSMTDNISGVSNTAVGLQTLSNNTIGDSNTSLGYNSLFSNTEGDYNTAVGASSLFYTTVNDKNTAIGFAAGQYYGSALDILTSATSSIFIGYRSKSNAVGQTNQIVIGNEAIGNGSNTATIGDDNVTDVYMAEDAGATVHAGQYRLSALNTAPANASATGTLGEIRVVADYIYVCTATDTWKRTAIATW